MKQIGRKLTLVLLMLLSAVMMLVGVWSIKPMAARAEGGASVVAVDTETVQGKWFKVTYSKDELSVSLSSNYRAYLQTNRGDLKQLAKSIYSAVREIVWESLLAQVPDDEPAKANAVAPLAFLPEDFDRDVVQGADWGNYEKYRAYLVDFLSDPVNFKYFVEGEYDFIIDYAVGSYIESRNFTEEEEQHFYNRAGDVMQGVLRESLQKMAEELFEENLSAGDYNTEIADRIAEGMTREEAISSLKEELCAMPAEGEDRHSGGELYQQVRDENNGGAAIDKIIERLEVVHGNGGKKPDIGLTDLVKAFKGVSVNGHSIYTKGGNGNDNGFDISGIRYLLSLIPRPSEIANMNAAQLEKLFSLKNVVVETSFGPVDFDLNFGFYGNLERVKAAARYLAEHVDLALGGSSISLSVQTPSVITRAFAKMLESPRFSDDVKNYVFSLFSMTTDELYDQASSITLEQLQELLKSVDYQVWFANFLNADFINSYFGGYIEQVTGHKLTQEHIYKLVDKLHAFVVPKLETLGSMKAGEVENWLKENIPYFPNVSLTQKGIEAVQKLLDFIKKVNWSNFNSQYVKELIENPSSKDFNDGIYGMIDMLGSLDEYYQQFLGYVDAAFGFLPDRFHDSTAVGLWDGEKFAYSASVGVVDLFGRIRTALVNRGYDELATVVATLEQMVEEEFGANYTYSFSFELSVPNLYKVEYTVDGETVREGFLPANLSGSVVAMLSNLTEIEGYDVLYWFDVEDETRAQLATMPAGNVVLAPRTLFTLELAQDVEKTYDGVAETLLATPYGVSYATYTYQWYKNGVPFGESTDTLEVLNVSDSGEYYVVATDTFTLLAVESNKIVVEISPLAIEITEPELVPANEGDSFDNYYYNGNEWGVQWTFEVLTELPEGVEFADLVNVTESGELVGKTARTYTAKIAMALLDESGNYTFEYDGYSDTAEWLIKQVALTVKWLDWTFEGKSFVFDGKEHSGEIDFTVTAAPDQGVFTAEFLKSLFKLTPDGTLAATNVGNYTASAALELLDTVNFVFANKDTAANSETFEWEITPFEFEVVATLMNAATGATYQDKDFTYNGSNHTVEWKVVLKEGTVLPEGYTAEALLKLLTVTPSGTLTAMNATEGATPYTALLAVSLNASAEGAANFAFTAVEDSAEWNIYKATLEISDEYLTYTEGYPKFTYTGEEIVVEVKFKDTFLYADKFTSALTGTFKATKAGEYEFTFTATLTDNNYKLVLAASSLGEVDGNVFVLDCAWLIDKAEVPVKLTGWLKSEYEFNFDRESHKITYDGGEEGWEKFFTVSYAYSGEVTAVGTYTVTATFKLIDPDNFDYEGETVFEAKIVIKPVIKPIDLSKSEWYVDGAAYDVLTYKGSAFTVSIHFSDDLELTAEEKALINSWIAVNGTLGNTFTNAGTYAVSLIVPENSGYDVTPLAPANITVNKATITVAVSLDKSKDTYTGTGIDFNVLVNVADAYANYFTVDPASKKFTETNVGTYNVTVTLTLKSEYTANYELSKTSFELSFEIEKKTLETPVDAWANAVKSDDGEYVYTFTEGNVDLTKVSYIGLSEALASYFTVGSYVFTKDGATVTEITAVGTYYVSVTVTLNDTDNFAAAFTTKTFTAKIVVNEQPSTVTVFDLSEVEWLINGEAVKSGYTYSGNDFTVSLSFPASFSAAEKALIEEWIVINGTYGTTFKNAGSYSIAVICTNPNYEVKNLEGINVTVAKAVITVNVQFNGPLAKPYTGEGIEFAFNVIVADEYKTFFTVDPAEQKFTETDVGKYNVAVTLTLKDEYKDNYELSKTSFEFTLEITEAGKPSDENWGAGYTWESEDKNATLTDVEGTVSKSYAPEFEKQENLDSYKDSILDAIAEEFEDKFEGFTFGAAYDIHFEDANGTEEHLNGKFKIRLKIPDNLVNYPTERLAVIHISDDGEIEFINPFDRTEDNWVEFEYGNFSVFAVIGLDPAPAANAMLLPCLIVIAVLLLIALILLIVLLTKVKNEETTEEPASEETTEEPVEEPAAEETFEPDLSWEPKPIFEEEPVIEEAVVVEEPVVEETVVEEPAEEPVVVPVEPIAEVVIEPVIIEEETMTVYDRSFTARLSQAEEPVRSYYSEIKNYILSYKFVRSRISWGYDSFTKGREKICKLQLKGKSLFMYIALDPDTLDEKYHHKSVKDVTKYEDHPTKLKIRSQRSLKYAKLFVDMMMEQLDGEQGEIESVDYTLPYRTTAELLEAGEIKMKEVPAPEFWTMDASDVIDNSPELPAVEIEDLAEEKEGNLETLTGETADESNIDELVPDAEEETEPKDE